MVTEPIVRALWLVPYIARVLGDSESHPTPTFWVGKVLNDAGRGSDDQIIDAIDWAAERGARVISMSLGSPPSPRRQL